MKSPSGVEPTSGDFGGPGRSSDIVSSPAQSFRGAAVAVAPSPGSISIGVRTLLRNRFVRFLLVGGLNTAFGYTIFAVCILIGVPYPVAALISTVLGVLFNFKSYGALVFGSHDNRRIFRFFAVYGICYVVGLVPLVWAKSHGVPILWIAAICALPMAALAFTLQRLLVFRGFGSAVAASNLPS